MRSHRSLWKDCRSGFRAGHHPDGIQCNAAVDLPPRPVLPCRRGNYGKGCETGAQIAATPPGWSCGSSCMDHHRYRHCNYGGKGCSSLSYDPHARTTSAKWVPGSRSSNLKPVFPSQLESQKKLLSRRLQVVRRKLPSFRKIPETCKDNN